MLSARPIMWAATSRGYVWRLCVLLLTVAPIMRLAAGDRQHAMGNVQPEGVRFYAENSFWNTPIAPDGEIDPGSSRMVAASLLPYAAHANFANTDKWGFPVAVAGPEDKIYEVACTKYCNGKVVRFRIPRGAQASTGSDRHLTIVDGGRELDMWLATYDPVHDRWSAATVYVTELYGWGAHCSVGQHCNGAVAAGFASLGGQVRPEEIRQGQIDHALVITLPYTRARFIACPATHTDGKYDDPAALPEGALIQLDPNFDVDHQPWPRWEKIIARALQKYGAYIADTGGSLAIRGVADVNLGANTWDSVATPKGPHLTDLPWNRFRVLKIRSCN